MYVNQLVAMHKQREQQEEVGGATKPEVSEERHAQIKRLTTTKEPLESAHAQYYDQVRFDVRAHSLYSAAARGNERSVKIVDRVSKIDYIFLTNNF